MSRGTSHAQTSGACAPNDALGLSRVRSCRRMRLADRVQRCGLLLPPAEGSPNSLEPSPSGRAPSGGRPEEAISSLYSRAAAREYRDEMASSGRPPLGARPLGEGSRLLGLPSAGGRSKPHLWTRSAKRMRRHERTRDSPSASFGAQAPLVCAWDVPRDMPKPEADRRRVYLARWPELHD